MAGVNTKNVKYLAASIKSAIIEAQWKWSNLKNYLKLLLKYFYNNIKIESSIIKV